MGTAVNSSNLERCTKTYTRVTTPNPNSLTNQIIHLRLLRRNPF